MPKEKLFFDCGELILNYKFTPETLLRAHQLALRHAHSLGRGDVNLEGLSRAHNEAIKVYLQARKDGPEWHMDKIMGSVLSNLGVNELVPVSDFSQIYKLNDHDFSPKGNIVKALEELSKKGSLHIISNTPHDSLVSELKSLGVYDNFGTITMSYEVGFRKPRKEIYIEALRRAGAEPSESTFVSHELIETNGAEKVGMRGVLANSLEEAIGALS